MTSILNTKKENVAYKVTGAGTEKANGIYYATEEKYGGVPIYSKTGNFKDRKDDSFLMWRIDTPCWYISTLRQGYTFQDGEIDYYLCDYASNQNTNKNRIKLGANMLFMRDWKNNTKLAKIFDDICSSGFL